MTLDGLKRWWPKTWREQLQRMYAQGFVLCQRCDGLPHEQFVDAHLAGCREKGAR